MPARFSSTASTIATRAPSTPLTMRRGFGPEPGSVSACTSTGRARRPSMAIVTQVPVRVTVAEEQGARVGHLGDAATGLLEAADLVGRTEPVLQGADEAQRGLPVALEVADDVDQVLEHARPATCPSFVTWPTMMTGRSAPSPRG
jgi:hypothetical protein